MALSDTEIRKRLAAGDATALEELYVEHASALARHAARILGNEAESAADVVHDVMLDLWNRRREVATVPYSLPVFLFGNVYRRAVDLARRNAAAARARVHPWGEAPPFMASAPTTPDVSADESKIDMAVHAAMESLSGIEREVVALRWDAGLPAPEIAKVLGISHAAVRTRLSRAFDKLRPVLERLTRS